ncbi:hypothetical protein [Phenylobacterium sp.]|uniref:hypothetical protein n=1 Tax=Phenylobacterium sp. TaxID=1871053 RepID=UPI002FC94F0B
MSIQLKPSAQRHVRSRCAMAAVGVATLVSFPTSTTAAPGRLPVTLDRQAHARLAAEVDAIFSKGHTPAVLAYLRDRGYYCYGPKVSRDPLPYYIRCEKKGWSFRGPMAQWGPLKQWIVVGYDEKNHEVLVRASLDLP